MSCIYFRPVACRLKKQPSRDDAPSKGDQVVQDDPASQGSNADSTTSGSAPKSDPSTSGTKVTSSAPTKGYHTARWLPPSSSARPNPWRNSPSCNLTAQAQGKGDFALTDRQDVSRDTAAAAEAKNADRGVASGSTRKHADDTGRPSESAPTASEASLLH